MKLITKHEVKNSARYTETGYLNEKGNFVRHNTDGPAEVVEIDDEVTETTWYEHGLMHREKKPAGFLRYACGSIKYIWYKRGTITRKNGPAIVVIDGGKVEEIMWLNDGFWSERGDKPNRVTATGTEIIKEWNRGDFFDYEEWHRLKGPAIVKRNILTGKVRREYWFYGERCTHKKAKKYNIVLSDPMREDMQILAKMFFMEGS